MQNSLPERSLVVLKPTTEEFIGAGSHVTRTKETWLFFLALTVLLAISSFLSCAANCENAPITLPIEVMGPDGTTAGVSAQLTASASSQVRSLWMLIHGLEYSSMVSVRLNGGEWRAVTNQTVQVAEPSKSYGGIGGGFTTLAVTLSLTRGATLAGSNSIEFRFNRSDGVKSGFRVLAFNLLDEHGNRLLDAANFLEENPTRWTAPLNDPTSLKQGERLWKNASLQSDDRPGAKSIQAHCGDCHARDGRDLKYFNFSNRSIIARAVYHGLSVEDGRRIASYIRTLPVPSPGRPWNPPYQPGPGQDAKPLSDWAAGAGLSYALSSDLETLPYLFPYKGATSPYQRKAATVTNAVGSASIHPILVNPTAADFAPDGTLNAREIPISFQLPDWNHWLPRVHPRDAWGARFESSKLATMYRENKLVTIEQPQTSSAGLGLFYERWLRARNAFLSRALRSVQVNRRSQGFSASGGSEVAEVVYSTQLWQLVKTWEMTEDQDLDSAQSHGGAAKTLRRWTNVMPASTAPSEIPFAEVSEDLAKASEDSDLHLERLRQEYRNNAWYELQILLNNGAHHHHGRLPVDWVYVTGHILELERLSHRPEPVRSLIAIIQAGQSSDPKASPKNQLEGWRPDQALDPRILVASEWSETFKPLPPQLRKSVAEAMLIAWLDKAEQYPAATYFTRGQMAATYLTADYKQEREGLVDFSGGKVWLAADQFRAAGVDAATVERLIHRGNDYSTLTQLFHY